MDERLKKQLDFILEIDKEKNILRQTHLSGHGRRENDAEHAWHMAIMAYLLQEYSNEPVDIARVMLMCLIHDVVEIDAGDTYAYDEEGLKTQKAREEAAKERIYSLLPEDQKERLTGLFDEFEACETAEAKFAKAMDNLQPLLLNHSNDGGDWREHGVTERQVYGRQGKTRAGSEKLYEVTDQLIQDLTGHIATVVRPPYGSYNDTVAEIAARPLILWSVDTLDWETQNADSTVQNVMDNASDGQIILMHDIFKESVDAAEIFIPQLLQEGYQLVTVSELAAAKGITLENGTAYGSF